MHAPIVDKADAPACIHSSNAHLDMIKEIKALKRHFSATIHVADVTDDNANKRLSFGSHAVGQPMLTMRGNLILTICQESLLGKHGLFDSPMDTHSDLQSLGDLKMHDNQ